MHHVRTQLLEKKQIQTRQVFLRPLSAAFWLMILFFFFARREFLTEILYKSIAIIAIQHIKIYFVDTFGDFSNPVE